MGMRNNARRSERSLVCAIQALVGTHILVELRNDTCVRGLLDDCDDAINVIIKDSLVEDVQGVEKKLPLIFIRGSHIRFVHIPLNISISQAVEDRRAVLDDAMYAYMGGKGLPAPKPGQTS
ncbi:hypothetical protein SUGI_1046780 [Cryptomeria japonica]|uniref:uncharacterized protein LOC131067514 isoform X4 n=1 Tax=Cryptomeria japonica TaxID=3369 RepID=UPI002414A0DF|nr:uncharacterized protein LOC131067514 isoform X4 [Cryptomeria japonica]GLJ49436.1 hypothetical protein SUGI_1046780 [Cryptomeria japonica]